jgi:hypothetical protein
MLMMMNKNGKKGSADGELMLSIHLMNGATEQRSISEDEGQRMVSDGKQRCCENMIASFNSKDPRRLAAALDEFMALRDEESEMSEKWED